MENTEELNFQLSQILLPAGFNVDTCTIRNFDSSGHYFSSDVKEVQVYVKSKEDQRSCLDLILKLMPGKEKQVQVNSELGFKKEAAFYKLAIPEYYKIQAHRNMAIQNLFPKLYLATDQIILLSDLRSLHFIGCNQRLDKKHTRLVLQEIAIFHATGVALKLANPDIFKSTLSEVVTPALQNAANVRREELNMELRMEITTLLKSDECLEWSVEKVDSLLKDIDVKKLPTPSEPYATLIHNDLWSGNILFKYSLNNEPTHVKLIDFQTTIYNSPARELVYFLFTSVNDDVLNEFNALISFYHCAFINYLFKLGCECETFTLERLMDEVNCYGPTKFKHIILLFKTLSSCSENYNINFKEHLHRIVILFKDRGWF